ncbi:Mediator of RNA polymerase II transcription subunit 16 [Trifolium repens]|nr:Mediator of RNA polymerase II transcription subunit 16 [Trifolium repens]
MAGQEENLVEEIAKLVPTLVKSDDGQTGRVGQVMTGSKGGEEPSLGNSRLGTGNASRGYTYDEVKVLFLVLMELCFRTSKLQHPLPVSQVGSSNIHVRLHYIDGNYSVLPEVLEASLGPHMKGMPRPRSADAADLLLRELELYPQSQMSPADFCFCFTRVLSASDCASLYGYGMKRSHRSSGNLSLLWREKQQEIVPKVFDFVMEIENAASDDSIERAIAFLRVL